MTLEQKELDRLEKRARNILLYQLGRSMKTRHQLEQIMHKREIPEEVFEPLLDRFTEAQLIDDAAYARAFVASRFHQRGKSLSAIRRELRQKGVADVHIEAATAEIDSEQELEIARLSAAARVLRSRSLESTARGRGSGVISLSNVAFL
ncbi:MAG: regulatory protein RecX [Actinobacteria bacterium]|nr:regulatory protein RecX [Actinomycetota bacterium]